MPSLVALAAVTRVLVSTVSSSTTRAMSLTGRGFRRMALTTVKMVVLAPIPSASDRIATKLNAGFLVSIRMAYRISCQIVCIMKSPRCAPDQDRRAALARCLPYVVDGPASKPFPQTVYPDLKYEG